MGELGPSSWAEPDLSCRGGGTEPCDADLLARARRTPSGGWLVQLTPTHLEIGDPVHLAALQNAYERLSEIGGRTSP
ncbi:DUF5953 family protein [Archangium lansingense]|uniref:DUF5953 family protein n=1 Tax=Archangium lansingense TaxID=2995310 RepID=UPI003B7F4AB8